MRPWMWWAIGGAVALALAGGGVAYSYGGPPLRAGVDRDPKKLLPGFAKKIETLFRRMRARGYNPMLWEGVRASERAQELSKEGTGIQLSMHILGAAVDIVDGDTPKAPWQGTPGFWQALGQEAERLGLVWGGRWSPKPDKPHVQAISVGEQTAFRRMTPAQRASYVA